MVRKAEHVKQGELCGGQDGVDVRNKVPKSRPHSSQSVHSSVEAAVMVVERRDAGRWICEVQASGRTTGGSVR